MAGLRGAQRMLARSLTSGHLGGWLVRSEAAVEVRGISSKAALPQVAQLDLDVSQPHPGLPSFQNDVSASLHNEQSPFLTAMQNAGSPFQNGGGVGNPGLLPQMQLSRVANFDLLTLVREMSATLSQGNMEKTISMFEEWVKGTDTAGQPNRPTLVAYNLLLHAKLRANAAPEHLMNIMAGMESDGITPNLLTYNFLLRAVFRSRDSEMAEKVLVKMESGGPESQPDADSYNFVVALCAMHRRLDAALKHMQAMLDRGFLPSKITYNEVLVAASKLRRTSVALSVMTELKNQSVVPALATCSELVAAAVEVDDAECALLALQFMGQRTLGKQEEQLLMDEGSMSAALNTAARTVHTVLADQAWDLLCKSLGDSRPPSAPAFLARIHTSAAAGDLAAAFKAVRELEAARGSDNEPEIFSPFSSLQPLVRACTKGGPSGVDAAYFKLEEMCKAGETVSLAAINCVILSCAKIWDAERAYQTFDTIGSVFKLRPDVHSCNALLEAFGKCKRISEVLQICAYIEQIGLKPDSRTYYLVVEAHLVNRDLSSAFNVLNTMVAAGHTPSREMLVKMLKRCQREGDDKGTQELSKSLGVAVTSLWSDRRKLMVNSLS